MSQQFILIREIAQVGNTQVDNTESRLLFLLGSEPDHHVSMAVGIASLAVSLLSFCHKVVIQFLSVTRDFKL